MQLLSKNLCLGVIITLCLNACSVPVSQDGEPGNEYRMHKLYYENSQGEKGISSFYYNSKGENYMAHWQLEDSSRSSLNYHVLDSNGNIIRKSRVFSDGLTSEQTFQYDSAGRLTGQAIERSDGIKGTTTCHFDENGILILADCRGLNTWFYGKIHYRYEEGIRTGAALVRDGDTIGSVQYGYEGDRLVYEFWDFNGQWSQTFRWEYARAAAKTFTSSNVFIRESPWYRVEEEYYDYNGQAGGPSHYRYAEDNRLENKEFVRSDGLATRTSYEYDSTGMLRYSYRAFSNGDTAVFHYWYGVNRELLVRTWEHPDGSRGSETYRYDEEGLLTEGIYENMDGWLNGTLSFSHDEAGIPVLADFSGNDGSNATVRFTYDLDLNLEKIHWEFSDGSTQTYTFQYAVTEIY